MVNLQQDLRLAWRHLLRRPGWTAIVVLTLGLGLGATSSILTVINAVLLQALPYPDADRLMVLATTQERDQTVDEVPVSHADFLDWRAKSQSFDDIAVHTQPRSFNLTAEGEVVRIAAEMVSPNYFSLLGQQPIEGRLFTAEEDVAADPRRVVLISHGFWQSRLGGRPQVLGTDLELNGERYSVLGILPPGFRGLTDAAEIWLPVTLAAQIHGQHYIQMRAFRWLSAVGKVKPETSVAAAQQEMSALASGLREEHPRSNQGIGLHVEPLSERFVGELRFGLWTLLGGALLVLIVAIANVSGLMLIRAIRRRREIAIRSAMGASSSRLLVQLSVEALVLAGLGGICGLILAHWATGFLISASAVEFKSFVDVAIDPLTLATIFALTLFCGAGLGTLSALWATDRKHLLTALQDGTQSAGLGPGWARFQNLLVVGEVALTLVLLLGAVMIARGFEQFRQNDLGFRTERILTLRTDLKGDDYRGPDVKRQLASQLLDRLSHLPGVDGFALASPGMPTDADWYGSNFTLEDRQNSVTDANASDGTVQLLYHSVSPDYFTTLGIPLLDGRTISNDDRATNPFVAVVSETLAKRHWSGDSAIGKRLKFGRRDSRSPWFEVVGVVGDLQHRGLSREEKNDPDVYFAFLQMPPSTPPVLNVLVRMAEESAVDPLVLRLREEVKSLAPDLPLYDVATLEQRLDRQTARDRFLVSLLTWFAVLALGLASLGIYGVISHVVSQRSQEIGIRRAFGAQKGDILSMVLGRGALLTLLGVIGGWIAIFLLKPLVERLFYGLEISDPLIILGATVLLFAVALGACYWPIRRALAIEPMRVLRVE